VPKIHVLPKHIADLIAAGEVVERPASVIKELMENAIDAGATAVTVEIQHGGVTYMRVTDDGCGIRREDIRNAFKSHATSKITTEEDLQKIGTLGFRGEALASIAAVSKVDVLTRTEEDEIGTVYKLEGSEEVLLDDAGCPQGTTIVVRDLFYNTPARMKFLKKDVTEGNAVAGVVDRIALSHPEVSIRFIRDDRQQLATPGNGKLSSAVYSVFGKDFAAGLLETSYELNGVKVEGLVSRPTASRANRSMQFFFLNGRLVKSKTAQAALEQAYKNAIMVGRFPACVLNITVPLETVDVNVHPAKTEVRFANEKPVFDAVYYAAKNAIEIGDAPNRVDLGRLEARRSSAGFKDDQGEQMKFGTAVAGRNGLPEKVEGFWSKELPPEYGKGKGSSHKSGKAPAEPVDPISHPAASVPANENSASADTQQAPVRNGEGVSSNPDANEPAAASGPVPYIPKNRKENYRSQDAKPLADAPNSEVPADEAAFLEQDPSASASAPITDSTSDSQGMDSTTLSTAFDQTPSSAQHPTPKPLTSESPAPEQSQSPEIRASEQSQPERSTSDAPTSGQPQQSSTVTEPYDVSAPQRVRPSDSASEEPAPVPYSEQTEVPEFRIIGEAFKTYILVQTEDKILLVDKHAAHERILFDQLKADAAKGVMDTQVLLTPLTVTFTKEEYTALLDNKEALRQSGFEIDDFGIGTIVLREVPVMLVNEDPLALLQEMAGYLLDSHSPTPEKLGWIYANTACRAAIKAGDNTPPAEQEKLVEYILAHRDIRYCPHGRPITIEMTRTELEKQFGRIQWHMN